MYNLPSSCLLCFFLFSLFHHLPCSPSQQERKTMFHCGNITAGFSFLGGNRHKSVGHPLLKLHCINNTTSLIISNIPYHVLHIDEASNTLRLARAELSFCNATFTDATLPTDIFELSPMYKNLTVFHHCSSELPYRSSYICPGKGPVAVSETLDYHNFCSECFTVNVPTSFVPEEKELNVTKLESVLSKGFEVKLKTDEKACQGCSSSHEIHQPGGMFLITSSFHSHLLYNSIEVVHLVQLLKNQCPIETYNVLKLV